MYNVNDRGETEQERDGVPRPVQLLSLLLETRPIIPQVFKYACIASKQSRKAGSKPESRLNGVVCK